MSAANRTDYFPHLRNLPSSFLPTLFGLSLVLPLACSAFLTILVSFSCFFIIIISSSSSIQSYSRYRSFSKTRDEINDIKSEMMTMLNQDDHE